MALFFFFFFVATTTVIVRTKNDRGPRTKVGAGSTKGMRFFFCVSFFVCKILADLDRKKKKKKSKKKKKKKNAFSMRAVCF
jgi:hypothetical protein